jgi:hypothetical protein
MTDEEFVRQHWEGARCRKEERFHPWNGFEIVVSDRYCALAVRGSEAEAWSAAAEFTRKRQEQIRQVEEEIRFVESFSCVATNMADEAARLRTRDRLKAALADLKRGMKDAKPE